MINIIKLSSLQLKRSTFNLFGQTIICYESYFAVTCATLQEFDVCVISRILHCSTYFSEL